MGASGCESGNLPGLVEAGTLREKECGDWPRYSREAFLLRVEVCVWLDWRSERELRGWLMRGRQSAGPSVFRVNKECLRRFSRVSLLGDGIGARVGTTEFFVRGDFLRDPWWRRGTRGGKRTGRRAPDTRCSKRRDITAERLGEE